jgi:hypothetical protein
VAMLVLLNAHQKRAHVTMRLEYVLILDEHNWEGMCDHLEKLRIFTLTFYSVSILSTIVKFEMIGHHGPCGGVGGCHRWFIVSFHLHGDMACLRAPACLQVIMSFLVHDSFLVLVDWPLCLKKQPKNI